MKLSHQIMNDVMLQEKIANNERYVGHAKEIRIHPEQFHNLMSEPDIMNGAVHFFEDKYRLHGYPLFRDPKVNKWQVIM